MTESPKLYYRADKRLFNPGEKIRTAGLFHSETTEAGTKTISLLDDKRPADKPERLKCLMLFENEECARNYCALMDCSTRKLYSVSISEDAVLHRADMHIVDNIDAAYRDNAMPDDNLPHDYWCGVLLKDPCVEVLVEEGTVVAQLEFSSEEGECRLRKRWNMSKQTKEAIESLFPTIPGSEDIPY